MTEKTKIILDTDPAMGERLGLDIDDDLALIFLLDSPQIEITGITTTYGNSTGRRTYRDAQRLLQRAGRTDIPVFKGAGWLSRDTSRQTDASSFIRETVLQHPGGLTLVTLGPLTNLAAALNSSPGLLSGVRELVMMGGRLVNGKSEFNFSAHPGATAKVLSQPCPKFIVTLDLCFQVVFTVRHLRMLSGKPDLVVAPWLGAMRRWLHLNRMAAAFVSLWQKQVPRGGFFPWDGIAVSYLVDPGLFTQEIRALMTMQGKKVNIDDSVSPKDPRAARLPVKIDSEKFMQLFMAGIASLTVS